MAVRVYAVIAADDDGSRRTPITPDEIAAWVERANEVFASANIRFDFNPVPGSGDWEEVSSTLLNTMEGSGHPEWGAQVIAANAIAAQVPDRVLVIFRWGRGASPTGGGFSWTDNNYVVMPGFEVTQVCGVQNIGLLAHEFGHYLGLAHTFRYISESVEQAESYLDAGAGDVNIFDGDGRTDTLPDPFVRDPSIQCATGPVVLNGNAIPVPRENPMSYYHPIDSYSPSQVWTMRQVLALRTGAGLPAAIGPDALAPTEPELVGLSVTGGSVGPQVMTGFLGRWSNHTQVLWLNGAAGDELTMPVMAPAEGRYRVYASLTAAGDFGIVRHSLNGQAGGAIDLYATRVLNTGPAYLGAFTLAAGENTMGVIIVGSNPDVPVARNGYGLDAVVLEKACDADIDDSGLVNLDDIDAFVVGFLGGDLLADLDANGILNFDDIDAFVASFLAGCP